MGEQLKSWCRKNVMGKKTSLGSYRECFLTSVPQLWEESDVQSRGTLDSVAVFRMLALAHGHLYKESMCSLDYLDPLLLHSKGSFLSPGPASIHVL